MCAKIVENMNSRLAPRDGRSPWTPSYQDVERAALEMAQVGVDVMGRGIVKHLGCKRGYPQPVGQYLKRVYAQYPEIDFQPNSYRKRCQPKLTFEEVEQAALALARQEMAPSGRKIVAFLGRGD